MALFHKCFELDLKCPEPVTGLLGEPLLMNVYRPKSKSSWSRFDVNLAKFTSIFLSHFTASILSLQRSALTAGGWWASRSDYLVIYTCLDGKPSLLDWTIQEIWYLRLPSGFCWNETTQGTGIRWNYVFWTLLKLQNILFFCIFPLHEHLSN